MIANSKYSLQIDLNEFKLLIYLNKKTPLTLLFNSPSRKFYLCVIALVVNEMKKLGKIRSISLHEHIDILALLNESVGGAAGASGKENLLPRIYRKWKDALPNLEEAPLFKVIGKKKEEEEEAGGKVYSFTDIEKDTWANLFEYMGSDENVRLRFALDKMGVGLSEIALIFGESADGEAWDRFISGLKRGEEEKAGPAPKTSEPEEEKPLPEPNPISSPARKREKLGWLPQPPWLMLMIALGVLISGLAFWKVYRSPAPIKPATFERMKHPLPDKPSIAVLPFVNLSKDPDQEYFSDGMTDDLITDLSKISGLFVIARNSAFTYKGKSTKVREIAEELGVRYLLEGSVRREGDEIRINAQLIDALTGEHLWAERYDGTVGKIFALQDQITRKIVNALAVKLVGKEIEQIGQKGTGNAIAHDEFLKGWGHYFRLTPEDFAKANRSFRKAVELDPNFDRAYAALALLHWTATQHPALRPGLGISWMEARLRPREFLQKAMKKPTSIAYNVSAQMNLYRRQHEKALSAIEEALSLDPNDPSCLQTMAFILNMTGRPKEATEFIERGMRLDPHNPSRYLWLLGWTHFNREDFAEAAKSLEKAVRLNPENVGIKMQLGAFYALLGRDQEAREAVDACRGVFHVGDVAWNMFFYPFSGRGNADRYAEGLLKAGVPPGKAAGGYFPAFKENQMTGEEIKKLLFGAKMTGIAPDGYHSYEPWRWEIKQNGDFNWRGTGEITSDAGKSRIEGDMICSQYQKRLWGIEVCGTVFKNPGGTSEGKDEFIICWDTGLSRFSVER